MKYMLVLIVLLCATAVSASYPDFKVTSDIVGNLSISNVNQGSLIITKQGYIPENRTISAFDTFTFQRYDKVKWNGNGSIEIGLSGGTKTILTPGSTYLLDTAGVYKYDSISSNKNGTIYASDASSLTVNVKYSLYLKEGDMKYTLKTNEIDNINVDNEKVVAVNINISKDYVPSDEYYVNATVWTSHKSVIVSKKTKIEAIKTFDIVKTEYAKDLTIKNGEFKQLLKITAENTGNVDYSVKFTPYGNASDFIIVNRNQTLIRNVETPINVMAQIPVEQADGLYSVLLVMDNGVKKQNFNFNITVKDNVAPEITNYSFRSSYLYVDNRLTVKTIDNLGAVSANVTVYYPPNGNNTRSKTFKMEKDSPFFYHNESFRDTGRYIFNVCVEDSSHNKDCEEFNKTFGKLNLVNEVSDLDMFTIKYGKTSTEKVFNFNLTVDKPVIVKLEEFKTDIINYTYDAEIDIKAPDGTIKKFDSIGSNLSLTQKGVYYLEVRSEREIDYRGILTVDVPDYFRSSGDIVFHGKFTDYDLPKPFTLEGYGKNSTCTSVDTGDLDTSYIRCVITYAANSKIDQLSIPVSVNEQKLLADQYNTSLQAERDKVRKKNISISALIGVLFIIVCIIIYTNEIYPNTRFRWGGD